MRGIPWGSHVVHLQHCFFFRTHAYFPLFLLRLGGVRPAFSHHSVCRGVHFSGSSSAKLLNLYWRNDWMWWWVCRLGTCGIWRINGIDSLEMTTLLNYKIHAESALLWWRFPDRALKLVSGLDIAGIEIGKRHLVIFKGRSPLLQCLNQNISDTRGEICMGRVSFSN